MSAFDQFVGIDYSGAKTPTASLKGLRVYSAIGDVRPSEVLPPPSPRKYWTRKGVADWLLTELSGSKRSLVGIDHAFSFPLNYFHSCRIEQSWPIFLEDFCQHWPTDQEISVNAVRKKFGAGHVRCGNARWRRLTEVQAGAAKSVFHFGVPGAVANSTHAGIPLLRFIRNQIGNRVHFWPFDGWEIPAPKSVVVEVYPALCNGLYPREARSADQHDAFSVSAWLQDSAMSGRLAQHFLPKLSLSQKQQAQFEGWILGVS